MSRQYYGIEDLGLTANQRVTLVESLKQLGKNQSPYPNRRNHRRLRNDSKAIIFEGEFNDQDWAVVMIKSRLAAVFNVSPTTIDSSTTLSIYGPIVRFARGGDKLRLIAFGGLLASWEESHDAVLEYLENNKADWGEVE